MNPEFNEQSFDSDGQRKTAQQKKNDEGLEKVRDLNVILHVPAKNAFLPPNQFELITVCIESLFDGLENTVAKNGNYPFVNYMFTNDIKKCGFKLIVEKNNHRFAHFSPCAELEYIYCIFNHESNDYAICKSAGLGLLGVMFAQEIKKSRAYISYLSNRQAFLNMLDKLNFMLKERYQKYHETAEKIVFVIPLSRIIVLVNEIENMHAECRYFILQIRIGLALISDSTDTKWKCLLENALASDPSHFENQCADLWFKRAVINIKDHFWKIKDGKCVGIDFPANHFTVNHCLEGSDDEREESEST